MFPLQILRHEVGEVRVFQLVDQRVALASKAQNRLKIGSKRHRKSASESLGGASLLREMAGSEKVLAMDLGDKVAFATGES